MSDNLFVTATEAKSGKSLIVLGIMEMLLRRINKVSFFRPIIGDTSCKENSDKDINLISSHFNLDAEYDQMYGLTAHEAARLVSMGKGPEMVDVIIEKYNRLRAKSDFVLCEGTDFASSISSFEFDINAEIIKNLGAPVLLVASAHNKDMDETVRSLELSLESLSSKGCRTMATIINHAVPGETDLIVKRLKQKDFIKKQAFYVIPHDSMLGAPTLGEIADFLGAEVLYGHEQLNRHARSFSIAAMQLRNFLPRVKHGSLIITPGDRADIITACLAIVSSVSMENISGILLTGGLQPEEPVWKLIKGFPKMVPILSVKDATFSTASKISKINAAILPDDYRKITRALALFEKNIDKLALEEAVITSKTTIITPKMFEYKLLQRARENKQHIVLPEGTDERILKAAEILLKREVVDLTLLGNKDRILEKIALLGCRVPGLNIIQPEKSEYFNDYVNEYYNIRKHKGLTRESAYDRLMDVNFFGTMMVYKGAADGMVSGAAHTTGDTIRPSLQIIKTKAGFSIVSSVFFMCLANKVLVYGDCAINPNPDAEQLAEIALSSANTAQIFGVEPVVAMLSYSTGESGRGEDVDRVRKAVEIAKKRGKLSFPDLIIEGPMQYDAAVDPFVASAKMPESKVAGKATVLIFPDLNTGNNTYKAVQRSAHAVAVGPVLQGLKHPVNDLSRGCTIPDIVNTVAITAVQAQAARGVQ